MPGEITCLSCNQRLRVPDDLLGKLVRCPSCGATCTATPNAPGLPAAPPPAGNEPPPQAPSPSPDSFRMRDDLGAASPSPFPKYPRDWEDETNVPSRRDRRGREWEVDEDYPVRRDRGEARALVAGPAIALMVVGLLAVSLAVLSLALNLAGIGLMANQRRMQQQGPDELAGKLAGGVCGAVLGVLWGGVVFFGALQMKNLRNYGLAMTSSIVALLPCNICCMLGLPFGIWGLVVLNQPEVRDAFT